MVRDFRENAGYLEEANDALRQGEVPVTLQGDSRLCNSLISLKAMLKTIEEGGGHFVGAVQVYFGISITLRFSSTRTSCPTLDRICLTFSLNQLYPQLVLRIMPLCST